MIRLQMMAVLILGLLWSVLPGLGAIAAYMTLPPITSDSANNPLLQESLKNARKVQLHFLKYRVYIPLEDIIISTEELTSSSYESQKKPPKKSILWCNLEKSILWIPIKYKVPIVGERVFQWCLNIPSA